MNLVESFSEFKEGKNIDRPTMVSVFWKMFSEHLSEKNMGLMIILMSSLIHRTVTLKCGVCV
jgi:hypothetical protein